MKLLEAALAVGPYICLLLVVFTFIGVYNQTKSQSSGGQRLLKAGIISGVLSVFLAVVYFVLVYVYFYNFWHW